MAQHYPLLIGQCIRMCSATIEAMGGGPEGPTMYVPLPREATRAT
jgi:hypothetical protein